jgi:hypothetical protein
VKSTRDKTIQLICINYFAILVARQNLDIFLNIVKFKKPSPGGLGG